MRTIDITPTWRGILPAIIAALVDGTDEGRKIAREELVRMADIADHAGDPVHCARCGFLGEPHK